MNSENLLAFVAHNLYIQDCSEQNKRPLRWAILESTIKLQYLATARHAFLRWEEEEKHLAQLRLDKKISVRGSTELIIPLMDPKDLQ